MKTKRPRPTVAQVRELEATIQQLNKECADLHQQNANMEMELSTLRISNEHMEKELKRRDATRQDEHQDLREMLLKKDTELKLLKGRNWLERLLNRDL